MQLTTPRQKSSLHEYNSHSVLLLFGEWRLENSFEEFSQHMIFLKNEEEIKP